MDIRKEHLEHNQDHLLEETLKNILKLAKKYRPNPKVNNVKLEFNVDISRENVIFNMLAFDIK